MAVPPIIPTSFVPHPAAGGSSRGSSSGFMGIVSVLAYLIFVLAIIAAGGVFIYGNLLAREKSSEDTQLAKAEAGLDQDTIQQFIQLHNRLISAQTLLDNHVALSPLFDLLESVTPEDADFSSVTVSIDSSGNALLVANGTAKSFNTLAAASDDFSASPLLKNTLFSNLAIANNGSVGFVLTASLDPKLIAYTGTATAPVQTQSIVPSATSTQTAVPPITGTATTTP